MTAPATEPFVGRERELDRISTALAEVLSRRPRVVLITGDPGIGKTRLADVAVTSASESEFTTSWARCWGPEAPAYWPWREALGQLGDADIDRFFDDDLHEFSRFEGIRDHVLRLAEEQPVAIVFDDIHLADAASLRLLEFVARNLRAARVLLIATCTPPRPDDDAAWRRSVASLAREGERLQLSGLSEDEVGVLFRTRVGGPELKAVALSVYRASEGNPFFVKELADLVASTGTVHRPDYSLGFRVPDGVNELVDRRLARLDSDLLEFLETAAVIGYEFEADLVAALCDVPVDRVLAQLGGAVTAGTLFEIGALGRFRFAHPLLRESLYERLTPQQRVALHARVARNIKQRIGGSSPRLNALAHHAFKGIPDIPPEEAVAYLIDAAKSAERQHAGEEAARLYRRAATVCDSADLGDEVERTIETGLRALGDAPDRAATEAEEPTFVLEGDYWSISYGGVTSLIKDSKGLRYLSRLLTRPDVEVHVLDLSTPLASDARGTPPGTTELNAAGNAANEVLDDESIRRFRQRLDQLKSDLDDATSLGDTERAAAITAERDAVVEHLGKALGLGGRSREEGSPAERARVAVTKAIRSAIRKIEDANPSLGRHLGLSINTGLFCSYTPERPIVWRT